MNKVDIKTEEYRNHVTRYFREDLEEVSTKFKQFAHFSQFSGVSRSLKKLPKNIAVRIDSSPDTYIGEITFGMDNEGQLTWLQELVDSSG